MPSITPTVTVQATPAIGVSTVYSPPYEDVRRSLGDYVYRTFMFYLASANFNQLAGVFLYTKYDANGTKTSSNLVPFISPYQPQKTLFFDVSSQPVIIDGRNSFQFTMLPLTTLKFKMFSKQDSVGQFVKPDGQPALQENNYKSFETATGLFNFFDDFKGKLP